MTDPQAPAAALPNSTGAKSRIFEGQLHDPIRDGKIFESFNIHTPPDIKPTTRVVGVLGVHPEQLAARKDEWFLSDFFAFWHLFEGMTITQTWYHCLNLPALVKANQRYLHGNPYKNRKVVLDEKLLKKAQHESKHPVVMIKPQDLLSKFKATVKDECEAAAAAGENVLILMFGHGDEKNYGIHFGSLQSASTFSTKSLRDMTQGLNVPITVVTSQCYGGGWACTPDLNLTTRTAAGKEKESISWRFSGSIGRACGSMFATTIINQLTQNPETGRQLITGGDDADNDEEMTDDQYATWQEFCQTTYTCLLEDVDHLGFTHELAFSARDDAWELCWSDRSGIPLQNYQDRWNDLPDWPADETSHPGDPFNRDPRVTEEQKAEYRQLFAQHKLNEAQDKGKGKTKAITAPMEALGSLLGKRKSSALYGGTLDGLIGTVKVLGADYLRSYPGNNETGNSGALHYDIQMIIDDQQKNEEIVEQTLRIIQFRMEQQAAADRYVRLLDLPLPADGKICCEFDTAEVPRKVPFEKYRGILEMIWEGDVLFPHPADGQGWNFDKGPRYLVAAFHTAALDRNTIGTMLNALRRSIEMGSKLNRQLIKRSETVQGKRQKLFHSFRVGVISPKKRRSIF
ncbi:MAG: hypothetical protein Q9216_002070 [Gyalolechia sp. 2 TL-2023]